MSVGKRSKRLVYLSAVLFTLIIITGSAARAQSTENDKLMAQGKALIDAQKFTEALPVYEKLAVLVPNDPEVRRNLGFSLLGQAANEANAAERRRLRIRARDSFVLARDYGDKSLLVLGMIEGLPTDGGDPSGFSDNAEANKAMQKGEAFFTSGKLDEALKAYKEALALDPRCYHAALFSGDVSMNREDYDGAETWYQKAISIDPLIETAYRYSATPLMKQAKYEKARDRYVEAFIVSPYSRLALSGIVQWGQVTKTNLGHPRVDIPEIVIGPDGKANSKVNINPMSDDGSMAWMSYVVTRDLWRKEKFARLYPKESTYRHSLAEETDALRSVVSSAKALKPKTLNSQISILSKLDEDGVLEAFVLMAIPDQGIASDHRDYLIAHRDKLRQYVLNYVISPAK